MNLFVKKKQLHSYSLGCGRKVIKDKTAKSNMWSCPLWWPLVAKKQLKVAITHSCINICKPFKETTRLMCWIFVCFLRHICVASHSNRCGRPHLWKQCQNSLQYPTRTAIFLCWPQNRYGITACLGKKCIHALESMVTMSYKWEV